MIRLLDFLLLVQPFAAPPTPPLPDEDAKDPHFGSKGASFCCGIESPGEGLVVGLSILGARVDIVVVGLGAALAVGLVIASLTVGAMVGLRSEKLGVLVGLGVVGAAVVGLGVVGSGVAMVGLSVGAGVKADSSKSRLISTV